MNYRGKIDPEEMDFDTMALELFEPEDKKYNGDYDQLESIQLDMEKLLEVAENNFEHLRDIDFKFFIKDIDINIAPILILNMDNFTVNVYEEKEKMISEFKADDMSMSVHNFLEEFSIKSSTTTHRINREEFIRYHLDPVYFPDFSIDYELEEFKIGLDQIMEFQLAMSIYEAYELRVDINELLSIDKLDYSLNYENNNILFDFEMKHPFLILNIFTDIIQSEEHSEPEPFSDMMIFIENLSESLHIEDFIIEGTYLNEEMKLLLIKLEEYLDNAISETFGWKDDKVIWDYSGPLSKIFEEEEEMFDFKSL